MRHLLLAAVAVAAGVVAQDDVISSPPPVVSFSSLATDPTDNTTGPATVSPSAFATDSSVIAMDSASTAMLFRLGQSAASNDANDYLEIQRTDNANAPAIQFGGALPKSAWELDQWQNALSELSNTITNNHLTVPNDNVRLGIQLTMPAKPTQVSFTKADAWHYGPTLVLADHALDGLTRLKELEFSNFNVSFEGTKWLAPDTTLKSLVFNKSTITSFDFDKQYTILRAEFRDSRLSTFPTALLHQSTFAEALTIESCTFDEPFKLTAAELEKLQTLPSVTFSQNTFPDATGCVQTVAYQGASICLTTAASSDTTTTLKPIESPAPAGGSGQNSSATDLGTVPPPTPLSEPQNSSSKGMLHVLVGVLCILGGIAMVAGFIYFRRRRSAHDRFDALSTSNRSDKFLEDDDDDDDVERGLGPRGTAYSQRTTTVGMGFLSDVDLGRQAVTGETRLGINQLWRADYRGETVVALKVNVEGLRERDRDIEAIVASCVTLRHPHIVEFLGTSMASSDEMWLVAEYMTKGSLRSVMFKKKLSFTWDKITQASIQIASALKFIQALRDSETRVIPTLSSRSVLCDGELNCKLDVFEFAQSARDYEMPVLSFGQGEIAYRAPEVLANPTALQLSRAEAARAEIYALGVILCELTFQSPVYTEILDARGLMLGELYIAREVAAGRLCPAPAADTPHTLARIIDACLAYDPVERPTATEVVTRLTALTE